MARLGAIRRGQGAATTSVAQLHAHATPRHDRFYDASKRLLDVVLALVMLILSLPVLTIAGLAIFATTRGNPLFLQTRVGLRGREFRMLKLRTMRHNDEVVTVRAPLAPKSPEDVRVSGVGRLLRRSSIDELPQLVNVLLGHMSLVGPRPALPEEVAQYPASWRRSLAVKPGMTGLWQVCGRSELSPRQRAALDRLYLRRRSFGYDCLLMLRTVRATISMRGAW